MGHLKDTIHIDAPVGKVGKFADDPQNWATYMAGMSGPDKIMGDGGVGTEYELTMVVAGVHMHLTSRRVEDREDPDGGGHARFDFEGSTSGWQTWDFKAEDGGTNVAVEMEYTVPGSLLGKIADRLVLERMEERTMHHSLENLKMLMEETPV